jgi:hypothetical protein
MREYGATNAGAVIIDLDDCELGSQGVNEFASFLARIREAERARIACIDLDSNHGTDFGVEYSAMAALCSIAARCRGLRFLGLHGNMIMRMGALSVAKLLQQSAVPIERLDLSSNNINPQVSSKSDF